MIIKNNIGIKLQILSVVFFFLTSPLIIILSFFTLLSLNNSNLSAASKYTYSDNETQIFASYSDNFPSTSIKLISSDARGDIIKLYLEKFNSPLAKYAYYIVNTADEYGIDFRLTTAIAQQESNLGKFIPDNTYNCWGWGIHSRGTLGFSSFEEGIKIVTEGLKKDYIDEGYITPDEIMKKYTPLSDGSWANGVNQFMQDME